MSIIANLYLAEMDCSENTTAKNVKMQKPEDWEFEAVGKCLLKLFHQDVISIRNNFMVLKQRLRDDFDDFLNSVENAHLKRKFDEQSGNINIGSLLYRTNFILNTPRGSKYYQIKNITLFTYSNKVLKEWDEKRLNGTNIRVQTCNMEDLVIESKNDGDDTTDPALLECFRVAEDAKVHPLEYQGSVHEKRDDNFKLSNMGCFICQINFESPEKFEEHVEWHNEETDFESLSKLRKLAKSLFEVSYTECMDSHYFCFNLLTTEPHVIIEKIIIVQSRSMFYVNNNRVPYEMPASGHDKFFVDSHLFSISTEQPIVIVFRYKSMEAMRIVEQHHFMRCVEFPKINFCIKANRLSNKIMFKSKIKLLQYLPNQEMKLALKKKFTNATLSEITNEFREYIQNNKKTTPNTMIPVLNMLLQIEDMESIGNFACLVQQNAQLRRIENVYTLKLKTKGGVFVENILSPYDEVLIIHETKENKSSSEDVSLDWLLSYHERNLKPNKSNDKKKVHYGIVERVFTNRVNILCDDKLKESDSYKVLFRPARLTLRYQYRALEILENTSMELRNRYFFPPKYIEHSDSNLSLDLFNPIIAENPEQLQAVRNIAHGPNPKAPYIIFGPPGTGKTTTLVEAILQLYRNRPATKILITAGSNSACDEIALRLCGFLLNMDDSRAMVRIYAKSNEKRLDNIDEKLLEASNMYGAHFFPDITLLHEYRIVICTLSVVGRLATGKFGKDDFGNPIYTHTFVDEVAASTATEVLVGIASTISQKNHLIMSGDFKQLGPVLESDRARELGLEVSLMEHLLNQECYKVDEFGNYNRSIQTRLLRNHRSHEAIVDIYSSLFYDGELISHAKKDDVDLASKWFQIPNPDYPIMFHSVFGRSRKGNNSVSLYNDREIEVVMDYVKQILCFGINGQQINQTDIGIISPYKKQYLRIQDELNARQLYAIETGSVEVFQGKEKPIIIVSFVRSFTNTLGFLDSPKRLNVTLSRAKSILILIGNPKTLSLSDDFKQIVETCRAKNSLIGRNYSEDGHIEGLDYIATMTFENKCKKQGTKHKNKNRKRNNGAKQKSDQNQKNVIDLIEEPQLGKPMKKRINPMSQQKQRKQFDKYQKLVTNDESASTSDDKSTIDKDAVFNSLPNVPSKKLPNNGEHKEDDLKTIESDIHEKLRKLRLIPPSKTKINIPVDIAESILKKSYEKPSSSSPSIGVATPSPRLSSALPAPAAASSGNRINLNSEERLNSSQNNFGTPSPLPRSAYSMQHTNLGASSSLSNPVTVTLSTGTVYQVTPATVIKKSSPVQNKYSSYFEAKERLSAEKNRAQRQTEEARAKRKAEEARAKRQAEEARAHRHAEEARAQRQAEANFARRRDNDAWLREMAAQAEAAESRKRKKKESSCIIA